MTTDHNAPVVTEAMEAMVELCCPAIARVNGIDWHETCARELDDDAECESSTCVAALDEDHDPYAMRAHFRALVRAVLTAAADHNREAAAYQAGRRAGLEEAIEACLEEQRTFSSPKYATEQPLSSFGERFACGQCADAIRTLIDKDAPPRAQER